MKEILQTSIPYDPLSPLPLPGIQPLKPEEWLLVDDAYSAQMAERERLVSEKKEAVIRRDPMAIDAASELLEEVLAHLERDHQGFQRDGDRMKRPDETIVSLKGDPLKVLSRLVQNDFCILQKPEARDEHVLTAAVLCFPANWKLDEKFMQPLTGIHVPVKEYDPQMAKRVQRLFDGVRVGRPMWRFNALWYNEPDLFQHGQYGFPRPKDGKPGRYMRSERQTIYRLPLTKAVIFGIHTFLVTPDRLA